MKFLYNKIKELDLGKVYSYVMENNPSQDLPYHNNFHLESVTKFTLLGAQHHDLDTVTEKNLAVAALFHDFNHSGSGKDDDLNIKRSIKGFNDYCEKDGKNLFTEFDQEQIINFIKPTRYPYLVECGMLSLQQKIIRDSDILQGLFSQNYIMGIVGGIAKEADIPMKKMLDGQEGFLKGTKFCTEWATNLSKERLPEILQKINDVKEFY